MKRSSGDAAGPGTAAQRTARATSWGFGTAAATIDGGTPARAGGHAWTVDLAALLVVTTWGVSFAFQKVALAEIDVSAFMFVRYLGMLALGWAVLLVRRAGGRPAGVARADAPRFVIAGVLGYSLYIVVSTVGLSQTTAFSNALMVGTAPLFAALLLRGLGLEAIGGRRVAGMIVALAGIGLVLSEKMTLRLEAAGLGDLLSLAGGLLFAAYSIASRPLGERYALPVVIGWTSTIGVAPVLALTLPAALAQDWSAVSPAGWAGLAWSIVVPVYLAWTLWAWVIGRAGVARGAVFMYLVPVAGAGASWALFGEAFGLLKLGGAALVLTGLALAHRRDPRRAAR